MSTLAVVLALIGVLAGLHSNTDVDAGTSFLCVAGALLIAILIATGSIAR